MNAPTRRPGLLSRLSISRKLVLIAMTTTISGLLVASLAFAAL